MGGQLNNLQIGDSHLSQDLLDTVKFDAIWPFILFRKESEGILHIYLLELWVGFQREDIQELVEIQGASTLLKHLLELLRLLGIGLKTDHLEDPIECIIVDTLVTMTFVNTCLKVENLLEILTVHIIDARLVI